jgi:hypothetical protein
MKAAITLVLIASFGALVLLEACICSTISPESQIGDVECTVLADILKEPPKGDRSLILVSASPLTVDRFSKGYSGTTRLKNIVDAKLIDGDWRDIKSGEIGTKVVLQAKITSRSRAICSVMRGGTGFLYELRFRWGRWRISNVEVSSVF